MENDLRALEHFIPNITHLKGSYLDLKKVREALDRNPHFVFPFAEDGLTNSLSTMVKLCVGKVLLKLETMSLWSNRPLREAQSDYGALDAFCQIEIMQVIKSQFATNEDFNTFIALSLSH